MAEFSEKNLDRIMKSKLNTTVSIVTMLMAGLLNFAERTVFNRYFPADYLGLFSFYNTITNMLVTVELGITSSIAFALYAPIEYKNKGQIAAIMHLFRRIYIVIGTIIFGAGLIIAIFFFPFLIKTSINMNEVRIYFLFFLLRTASNYFFGYKLIMFNANQEQYKTTLVSNLCWCVLYALDIVITITTENFLIYAMSISLLNFTRLIILNRMCTKEFGKIFKWKRDKLSRDMKTHILNNSKGLILSKMGNAVVSITDSVLISSMVGIGFLGKYANYQLFTSGLRTAVRILPSSITASIGNANVTEDLKTMEKSFYTLDLASFFIYSTFTIFLVNLFNPIISFFFGTDKVISMLSVVIICIDFYLANLREMLLTYKTSLGLYWEDRRRPLIEGLVNLVVSIILGYFWGFNGIIIGTIVSNVFVNLMIEPVTIMHDGFNTSVKKYYIKAGGRFLLAIVTCGIAYAINSFIPATGFAEIIIKTLVTVAVIVMAYIIVYFRNDNARLIMKTLKVAFTKRNRKSSLSADDTDTGK